MNESETSTPTIQAPSYGTLRQLAFDLYYHGLKAAPEANITIPEFVHTTVRQAMELACSSLLRDPESRDWLYANIATDATRRYMDADRTPLQSVPS